MSNTKRKHTPEAIQRLPDLEQSKMRRPEQASHLRVRNADMITQSGS
jgi:hypothetical protein